MSQSNGQTINCDRDVPGTLPTSWTQGVTGKGAPRWAISEDPSAPSKSNVLQQSGHGTFPWCVLRDSSIENGYVEVKFKAISGDEDQAGGIVWRWKDGNRYYVSLYYTEDGRRNTLKYIGAPFPANVWHTLRVEFSGPHITVALNGKAYIELDDDHIEGAGAVGLWTKADSVTAFDDFCFGGK